MADHPWITPNDVRMYTSYDVVKDRDDLQLRTDIQRAEQRIIRMSGNGFEDNLQYPEVPEAVKTATLLVAQVYALNESAGVGGVGGAFRSESIGDYSYTMAEVDKRIDELDILSLLEPYMIDRTNNQIELYGISV